jgi:hypothetical protein
MIPAITKNNLIALSDVTSGFIIKVKDGHILFDNFAEVSPLISISSEGIEDVQFCSVYLKEVTPKQRQIFYANTLDRKEIKYTTLVVSNSECNLSCEYCLSRNRPVADFASVTHILKHKELYPSIRDLHIFGGEPTIDKGALKNLLLGVYHSFDSITLFTNGLNLDDDLMGFIRILPTKILILRSLNVDNFDQEFSRLSYDYFDPIPNDNLVFVLNVLPGRSGEILHIFERLRKLKNTDIVISKVSDHKINPPYNMNMNRFIQDLVDSVPEQSAAQNFKSADIRGLNYLRNNPSRPTLNCNINRLVLVGDYKYTHCLYAGLEQTSDNPQQHTRQLMEVTSCSECASQGTNCEDHILTPKCAALPLKCRTCPLIYSCTARCHFVSDASEDACSLHVTLMAYNLWLSMKDKTKQEALSGF